VSHFHTEKEAEYLRYREECLAQARSNTSQSQRIMLLHIAATWLRLAESERGALPSTALH